MKSKKPTIVVAGYGSWPTAPKNPCGHIAEILDLQTFDECNLHGYSIPVVSNDLYKRVHEIIDLLKPDAWIGLGVAVRYTAIKAELVGLNKLNLPVPDAAGNMARTQYLIEDAPLAYESTLPNQQIIEAIKGCEIPAIESFYAGTHMCNQMLFTSLHLAQKLNPKMRAGFLHLPQAMENVVKEVDRIEPGPFLPMDKLLAAVRAAIQCTAEVITHDDK